MSEFIYNDASVILFSEPIESICGSLFLIKLREIKSYEYDQKTYENILDYSNKAISKIGYLLKAELGLENRTKFIDIVNFLNNSFYFKKENKNSLAKDYELFANMLLMLASLFYDPMLYIDDLDNDEIRLLLIILSNSIVYDYNLSLVVCNKTLLSQLNLLPMTDTKKRDFLESLIESFNCTKEHITKEKNVIEGLRNDIIKEIEQLSLVKSKKGKVIAFPT